MVHNLQVFLDAIHVSAVFPQLLIHLRQHMLLLHLV